MGEIERLLFTYAELLDAGDFDGVAALFARATFDSTSRHRAEPLAGVEQIRRMYDQVQLYAGTPRTRHLITNVVIELESPSTSRSRCAFTVMQAVPGGPLRAILAGRYHDRFARFDDGWWFTSRVVLPDLHGDLRAHFG